jgi:hypothetical protein
MSQIRNTGKNPTLPTIQKSSQISNQKIHIFYRYLFTYNFSLLPSFEKLFVEDGPELQIIPQMVGEVEATDAVALHLLRVNYHLGIVKLDSASSVGYLHT